MHYCRAYHYLRTFAWTSQPKDTFTLKINPKMRKIRNIFRITGLLYFNFLVVGVISWCPSSTMRLHSIQHNLPDFEERRKPITIRHRQMYQPFYAYKLFNSKMTCETNKLSTTNAHDIRRKPDQCWLKSIFPIAFKAISTTAASTSIAFVLFSNPVLTNAKEIIESNDGSTAISTVTTSNKEAFVQSPKLCPCPQEYNTENFPSSAPEKATKELTPTPSISPPIKSNTLDYVIAKDENTASLHTDDAKVKVTTTTDAELHSENQSIKQQVTNDFTQSPDTVYKESPFKELISSKSSDDALLTKETSVKEVLSTFDEGSRKVDAPTPAKNIEVTDNQDVDISSKKERLSIVTDTSPNDYSKLSTLSRDEVDESAKELSESNDSPTTAIADSLKTAPTATEVSSSKKSAMLYESASDTNESTKYLPLSKESPVLVDSGTSTPISKENMLSKKTPISLETSIEVEGLTNDLSTSKEVPSQVIVDHFKTIPSTTYDLSEMKTVVSLDSATKADESIKALSLSKETAIVNSDKATLATTDDSSTKTIASLRESASTPDESRGEISPPKKITSPSITDSGRSTPKISEDSSTQKIIGRSKAEKPTSDLYLATSSKADVAPETSNKVLADSSGMESRQEKSKNEELIVELLTREVAQSKSSQPTTDGYSGDSAITGSASAKEEKQPSEFIPSKAVSSSLPTPIPPNTHLDIDSPTHG